MKPHALALLLLLPLGGCVTPSVEYVALNKVPAPFVSWRDEAAEVVKTMPFLKQGGNLALIVADMEIKGIPERFLIDTASQLSMVTPEFCARHAHRKAGAKAQIEGVDGIVDVDMVVLDALDFGFARIDQFSVEIAPKGFLDSTNKALRNAGLKEISGIIGTDLLRALNAAVDFGGNKLILRRSPAN